jgi:hypothetical protein
MTFRARALGALVAVLIFAPGPVWASEPAPQPAGGGMPDGFNPTFEIRGYLQSQVGVFISTDEDAVEPCTVCRPQEDFPSDHGGKLGELSMLLTTLQVEGGWTPADWLSLRAIVRASWSPVLEADREAQPPHIDGKDTDGDKRADWVADTYYRRIDLREVYLDLAPIEELSFRVGRQLIPWGESGGARLLDVVNPVNAAWHFSSLESYEDIRTPIWALKALWEIPPLSGGLEAVWVPMLPGIERPEDTVTAPLTFVGAWGLPLPPQQADTSVMPRKIAEKHFHYPAQKLSSSRVGLRWKGELGNHFGYTLMYYYGHQMSPPIPDYYETSTGRLDLHLRYPRLHTAGFALESNLPFPVSTMFRLEGSVEPNRTYPYFSIFSRDPRSEVDLGSGRSRVQFRSEEMLTAQYAFTIQQGALIRAMNPTAPVIIALQFQHTLIPGLDEKTRTDCMRLPDGCLLDIPGYDSTLAKTHQIQVGGAMFSSYFRGLLTPKVAGAWLVKRGGLLAVSLTIAPTEHWQIRLAVNQFFGDEPYYGVGFFRDRDEVNLRLRFQL